MKSKIHLILIVVLGVILCESCTDFTEVGIPQSRLAGAEVFEDQTTATAALLDIYARMRENGLFSGGQDGVSFLMGVYADDFTYYGGNVSPTNDFFNHTLIPSNGSVLSVWTNSYTQIYAVNALIEGVENSPGLSEEVRGQLQGEAIFIRALLHFYLVNLYGDIPYVTTTDYRANSLVSRHPVQLVYDQIIADLEEAKQLLPIAYSHQERTRVNRAAAQALLSRVYLYQEEWALAEVEASDVIGYQTLYDIEMDLDAAYIKGNPSTIWQLHPGIAGANAAEGRMFNFTSGPPAIVAADERLVDAFADSDLRKQHWFKSVTDGADIWYHPYKYKENSNTGVSREYSIILRLEEQYLIRAEARAQLEDSEGAKADLNKIRHRAGLGDTPATSKTDLLAAILAERRWELFTEMGHRWFDLKRTGQAEAILAPVKAGWDKRGLLLPLPEKELILNSNLLPQNSGY